MKEKKRFKNNLFKSNSRKHYSHLHPCLIPGFTAYTSLAVSFSIYLRESLLPDIMEVKDFPKAKDYSCLNKPEKGDLMAYRIELLIPAVPLQYRLSPMLVFLFFHRYLSPISQERIEKSGGGTWTESGTSFSMLSRRGFASLLSDFFFSFCP